MKKSIMSFVESLKVNQKLSSFDKASTKQAIVMRLFSALEWDIFDVETVKPDYKAKNLQVDYALRCKNRNRVFVEVKPAGEALADHPQNLLNHAVKEKVDISIVTNGLIWWFYLSTESGDWDLRRYCVLDLIKYSSEQVALKFIDILSREAIASGKSVKAGEAHLRIQQQKVIEEVLPEAWKHIITEPHEELVNLLKGMAEKLSGHKADKKVIVNYLKENVERFLAHKPQAAPAQAPATAPKPKVALKEETIKQVTSFLFKGETCQVRSWPDLLVKLCEVLRSKDNQDIEKLLWQQVAGRNYFTQNPAELSAPLKITGTDIYMESQLAQADIIKLTHAVLTTFGYSNKDLTIDTISN